MASADRISLNSLPYDLLLNIALYLDTRDVHALHLTCRSLYDFSSTRPVYRKLTHNLLRRCRPLPLKGFQRLADLSTEQLIRAVNKAAHFDYAWRIRPPRPITVDPTGTTPPRSNYMDITPGSQLAKRTQEQGPKWYKIVSAPPGEAVDWLSPITSSYTLCATKSGKVVCWDVQSDQCLAEWNPGPQWELWKCRVEFEERTIYFTMAKVLSGTFDDDRIMQFVLMKLTFFDSPSGESSTRPPVFSKVTEFRTRGVVMNVFLLDPTKRLLSAFIWIAASSAIGLYVIPDWDKNEYVFIDTGIDCIASSNWSCILYQQNIVIHCEETNAAFQHFYPLSLLQTAATTIRSEHESPVLSWVMPPARTLSKKFIFPLLPEPGTHTTDHYTYDGGDDERGDDDDASSSSLYTPIPGFVFYNGILDSASYMPSPAPSVASSASTVTSAASGSISTVSSWSDVSATSSPSSWTHLDAASPYHHPHQPHPLASSTTFPPSPPSPTASSESHFSIHSYINPDAFTSEPSEPPFYSTSNPNPFPFPKWTPESAHFVRQWWPSLPSIPRVSCTVVLLSHTDRLRGRTRFVLAQHYFRVPLDLDEWNEGLMGAVGNAFGAEFASGEGGDGSGKKVNGKKSKVGEVGSGDGQEEGSTTRSRWSPPSSSSSSSGSSSGVGPGSSPAEGDASKTRAQAGSGVGLAMDAKPVSEDDINEDALMRLWYVSEPFEVVRILDDNSTSGWTADDDDDEDDEEGDEDGEDEEAEEEDEDEDEEDAEQNEPSTNSPHPLPNLTPAAVLFQTFQDVLNGIPPPVPPMPDDDDDPTNNRPRPLVAVDFGHAVWIEYVEKDETQRRQRGNGDLEKDEKWLRFVTFPPFGDEYGECVEEWGRALAGDRGCGDEDEEDEELQQTVGGYSRDVLDEGSRRWGWGRDREWDWESNNRRGAAGVPPGGGRSGKGKDKGKGRLGAVGAGGASGSRGPRVSKFRPGEVQTIPHPPELDLGRVETINIDQSQGAVILSDKDGRIFILCYE